MVSERSVRVVIETLEDRRLLSTVTLANGSASGALSVGVDAYGAFGLVPTGISTQYSGFRVGQTGAVNRSYVMFSPSGQFLTEGAQPSLSPTLTPISFESTSAQSAVSTFVLSGNDISGTPYAYQIELTQSLSGITPVALGRYQPSQVNNFQSTLLQTYRITNLLGTTTSFSLTRYYESQVDGGGAAEFYGNSGFLDGGRTLVQAGIANANFVQVHSYGGTFVGAAINRATDTTGNRTGGLDGAIAVSRGIPAGTPNVPAGSGNLVAGGSFYNDLVQQYSFVTGPRETVEFTTTTTLGQKTPIALQNLAGTATVAVSGDFAFAAPSYNYAFPLDGNGAPQALAITIDRLSGSSGAVALALNVSGGDTPASSYVISPTTVNFADGQTSATVLITFNLANAAIQPTSFQLSLTPSGGNATAAAPSFATINVLPRAAVFEVANTPLTATEGQGTLNVTLNRTGNINGPASVILTRTSSAGATFTSQVDFADGETSKVVAVPVIDSAVDTGTRTETITLTGIKPGNGATGDTSLAPNPTASITVTQRDAIAPTVLAISTQGTRKKITGVVVTFSEDLNGVGNLSNYVVATRSNESAFGAAKSKAIPLAAASYDPATHNAVLVPAKALATNKNYALTVISSAALVDKSGNAFFQDVANNRPNYTAYFSRATKITYVDQSGDKVNLSMKDGFFDLVRAATGEAATVTLFGDGAAPFFRGNVKKGSSTIGSLVNTAGATVELVDITVGTPA